MKAFDFSLEKILELREFDRRQCEIELGKAISESTKIKQKLQNIAEQRVFSEQNRYKSSDLGAIAAVENYITRLDTEKEKNLNDLAANELVVEKKRTDLAEAMKQHKVLAKLKEKQLKEYKKEKNKKEEQEIDDITTTSHS